MNKNKLQQACLALFAAVACGFGADASALPTTTLNHGVTAPGGTNTGFGGNAGAMLPATLPPLAALPADPTPSRVPMPAHLPSLDPALPPAGTVPQQLPAPLPASQVPEPRTAALLLGGLALMGLASRRRRH